MRIEIDPSAANDPEAHRWLDRILHRIEDGWHVWDTSDPSDPGEMETTTWIRDRDHQGDWVRELLAKSVKLSAWDRTLAPHGRSIRVTVHPCTSDELTPKDALRLAEEPLCILVENRFSDGPFVVRVVEELDKSLHDLWKRPGEPVRIDSVGGKGQMRQEVERRTSGKPYRPRLVAIVDSDRKSPGASPSREARKLRRACEEQDLPCWILDKREAENYLPRVLLLAWQNAGKDHERRVGAWDRLSDDQKNFFDMKRGLPNTPSNVVCKLFKTLKNFFDIKHNLPNISFNVVCKLFETLSPADRMILSNGFGPNVHKCWTLRSVPAKAELSLRGQGDLEHGIKLIRREV